MCGDMGVECMFVYVCGDQLLRIDESGGEREVCVAYSDVTLL